MWLEHCRTQLDTSPLPTQDGRPQQGTVVGLQLAKGPSVLDILEGKLKRGSLPFLAEAFDEAGFSHNDESSPESDAVFSCEENGFASEPQSLTTTTGLEEQLTGGDPCLDVGSCSERQSASSQNVVATVEKEEVEENEERKDKEEEQKEVEEEEEEEEVTPDLSSSTSKMSKNRLHPAVMSSKK